MLLSLIIFAYSRIETLTDSNYSLLINENQKIPVFALLESRWCTHCMELKPTWTRVQEHYKDDERFVFADISCDTERELCDNFSDSGTPRIFWVKNGIETAERFVNSYTYDEFVLYVEKKLSPIVVDIDNHSQFLDIIEQNQEMSLFFLQDLDALNGKVNEDGFDSYQTLLKIAPDFEQTPSLFYHVKYEEFQQPIGFENYPNRPIFANLCPWVNTSDKLKSALSEKTMRSFIDLYSYPQVYSATSFFIKSRSKAKRHFMLYFDHAKPTFYGELLQIASTLPPWFKTGVINCMDNVRMCRIFGFNMLGGHELSIVLTHKNIYYHYNGPFTNESVTRWINNVLDGKVTPLGPGAGIKGFFFNLKIKMNKPEWWKNFAIKSFATIVIGFIAIKVILKCIELGTPPPYEEEIDKTNSKDVQNTEKENEEDQNSENESTKVKTD